MATLAARNPVQFDVPADVRFAARTAILMAVTVVVGFFTQWAMGRSTFASPLRVHLHAFAFMGWVALFVTQGQLALRGETAFHRKLGWIGTAWLALMLAAAINVIVAMTRNGTVPFFFTPQQLLIADPMTLLAFVGLTFAAVAMRRRTDWHVRLHICAMSAIMAPAFGRMLPMPLLVPYAFETSVLFGMVFVVAGMIRDMRKYGTVHPAWLWGIGAVVVTVGLSDAITYSSVGNGIYRTVTAGYPGERIPGLEFPKPPPTPLITGR
ncbi:MAG: hypothetical protein KGM49_06200 [Sphingomonadales bacterium]|nr:hypothetical protein [Sphingomonadales bacterium]